MPLFPSGPELRLPGTIRTFEMNAYRRGIEQSVNHLEFLRKFNVIMAIPFSEGKFCVIFGYLLRMPSGLFPLAILQEP